jgi:hypothetical protein
MISPAVLIRRCRAYYAAVASCALADTRILAQDGDGRAVEQEKWNRLSKAVGKVLRFA